MENDISQWMWDLKSYPDVIKFITCSRFQLHSLASGLTLPLEFLCLTVHSLGGCCGSNRIAELQQGKKNVTRWEIYWASFSKGSFLSMCLWGNAFEEKSLSEHFVFTLGTWRIWCNLWHRVNIVYGNLGSYEELKQPAFFTYDKVKIFGQINFIFQFEIFTKGRYT